MDNLLQPVLESYPKLTIEKQFCPSYVEMYTKNSREIVMVFVKNKLATNTIDSKFEKDNKCEAEELELTGSPLKLDLSLHTILDDTLITDEPQLWTKEEASHLPVAINKARDIANLYNKSLTTVSTEDAIPMWILTNPSDEGKPLLLTVQSDDHHFARGIVTYEGSMTLEEVDLDKLVEQYAAQERINTDLVTVTVDCKYLLSGISYGSHTTDELLNAPHGGLTELHCEWQGKTLVTPFINCKVNFEQEVIVGHLASPCNAIWKSVCSLHNINQLLVDMTAAGSSSVNLETAVVRNYTVGMKKPNNTKRLSELLNETETYAYTAECPAGGCTCVTEDTSSLRQCLSAMNAEGSSNDFTYKLWDILRDCETAEELVTLLIQALKFISSGKIRPFIDANNKTYLSKLVLKLSRGHSQTAKVLKNLRSSSPQALSLVAQVGTEKTMWEYTRVMSLLEHSFYIAGIWTTDARSHESIEQINQTIQDMTMGGDFTLNPFDNISTAEHSIRLDCESFYVDDTNDLTVDDFASLKKHGLVAEKKDANEVPIIADEIDISPWKNLLMKFAQVHVCLEHLYRAETCLRADFTNLKPIATRLLEHYVSERSPIKTVGQVLSDPVQKIRMPIANNIVQDHLKKPAYWYRTVINRKENSDQGLIRDCKLTYVSSQQPVFPPSVWQNLEPPTDEVTEITTIGEELKYHTTKFTFLSNNLISKLTL
ncbi:protein zwilch isoform X1 [Galleria mellonella]|uniref:Protein zwilch n=1 Tax=Galleria mellonella TaxID=7137 RepID=A0ABM3MT32_GALME|nr:protein zwilch isoform X1 [Galleria mellonella]